MKKVGDKLECYSKKFYGFLTMHGIRYEYTFKHNKTGRIAYVYIVTEEIIKLMTEWSEKNN